MTTNQTIDGVPCDKLRDMLNRMNQDQVSLGAYGDELRALLDAADHVHEWDINAEGTATVCHCGVRSSDEQAEQPAPVALTQDTIDRIVPSLNPEPDRDEFHCEWALWSDRERIRSKLSTLLTANPAPAAVVMPEHRDSSLDNPNYSHARGWNACLDELKRLNPSL